MIDKIKEEINKENPDWLMISRLAMNIHNSTLESNFFRFKKGKLNIIKASEHNCDVVEDVLKDSMGTKDYEFLLVGSYKGMTVTAYNKLIKGLSILVKDKFVVVVTNKDQVVTNSIREGLIVNPYKAVIRNKWTKAETTIQIKGEDGFELSCDLSNFKQQVRDLKLEDILDLS